MFSLKGILLLALVFFIFLPIVNRIEGFTPHGERAPGYPHSGVNLWLFFARLSLNVRNRCSDQFTALSTPQAGRRHHVTDLLLLAGSEKEERLPQLIMRKPKGPVRTFFPTSWIALGLFILICSGQPQFMSVVLSIIINSTPTLESVCVLAINYLYGLNTRKPWPLGDGSCLPCWYLLMLEPGAFKKCS